MSEEDVAVDRDRVDLVAQPVSQRGSRWIEFEQAFAQMPGVEPISQSVGNQSDKSNTERSDDRRTSSEKRVPVFLGRVLSSQPPASSDQFPDPAQCSRPMDVVLE